jgi:hypothetical protein
MIARIWTGATRTVDADACQRYMREVALSSAIAAYRTEAITRARQLGLI